MNIALVNFYPEGVNIRALAAFVKQHGHACYIFHVLDRIDRQEFQTLFLDQLARLEIRLLGISVVTDDLPRAQQLTMLVKHHLDIPVIWGGIHPTLAPESSLDYADYVCVHDGEIALTTLADKLQQGTLSQSVDNLVTRNTRGRPVKLTFVDDLSDLPPPDLDFENHFVVQDGTLHTVAQLDSRGRYSAMTSRGCPFSCTYCLNSLLKQGRASVRKRPLTNVMVELIEMRRRLPQRTSVYFLDDLFLSYSTVELGRFAEEYRKHVALPFFCMGHVNLVTEEKVSILKSAGLLQMQLGIQSGSEATRRLYGRHHSNAEIVESVAILKRHDVLPLLDVIYDCPFESVEDVKATLALLLSLPRPFKLQGSSLFFMPNCVLTSLALETGKIRPTRPHEVAPPSSRSIDSLWKTSMGATRYFEHLFDSREKSYWNGLIALSNDFPVWLIRALALARLPALLGLLYGVQRRIRARAYEAVARPAHRPKNLREQSLSVFHDAF